MAKQLKAILWKNWLLKYTHPWSTAAELLLPALRATPTEPLAIDAAVARIAERRQPEISVIQRLQHQETQRADLLRRHAGLRQVLALSAPWSGPLLAHHWLGQQRILRDGLP